ncbi:MAG: Cof-type HAD-IIB family hydrolase [Actinomycetaceae bacterium]|nr:Cof-type HAD-IIB family hydrolase [Actinomycetaceae bacterium]
MKKLVFLDLDGTVINADQTVPESTREACRRAVENGHTLWMCTGRCLMEIYPWLWDIGFHGFIGANGAHGRLDGEDLFDHRISAETIAQVDAYFKQHGITRVWQAPDAMHPSETYMDDFFAANEDVAAQWAAYMNQVRPYFREGTPTSASKAMFTIPPTSDLQVEDVAAHFAGTLEIIPASVDTGVGKSGELTQVGYSKGTGLREVAQKLGFPIEHTVAVGDSYNDLELVKSAGLGIAMGNAVDHVKSAAKWVSTSIDEDGLANALDYAGLLD